MTINFEYFSVHDVVEYFIPHHKLPIDNYPYLLYENVITWQKRCNYFY